MKHNGLAAGVACFGLATALALPVGAQVREGRPYQSLFGGSDARPNATQTLDATAAVAATYDENVRQDATNVTDLQTLEPGWPTDLSGSVSYEWRGRSVRVSANGSAGLRGIDGWDNIISTGFVTGIGLSTTGAQTGFTVNYTTAYTPASVYGVFQTPGEVLPVQSFAPIGGFLLGGSDAFLHQLSSTARRQLGRRSFLDFIVGGSYTAYRDSAADARAYTVGGRYSRTVTRNATLRLGYTYRGARYPSVVAGQGTNRAHDLDLGIDYAKALSPSRRTTLSFGLGSGVLTGLETQVARNVEYQVNGNLRLNHEFGRSWRALGTYSRGLSFVQEVGGPVFSDTVNATVDGFASSRVGLTLTGTYSNGGVRQRNIDPSADSSDYALDSYTASSLVMVALTRNVAAYTEYFYYKYSVGTRVFLPSGVPQSLDGSGVRVGLTVWAPLLRR